MILSPGRDPRNSGSGLINYFGDSIALSSRGLDLVAFFGYLHSLHCQTNETRTLNCSHHNFVDVNLQSYLGVIDSDHRSRKRKPQHDKSVNVRIQIRTPKSRWENSDPVAKTGHQSDIVDTGSMISYNQLDHGNVSKGN